MHRAAVALALLLAAAPAGAELAVLENGSVLEITGRRLEAGAVVLVLEAGGELAVAPAQIAAFVPDEVVEAVAEVAAAERPGDLQALAIAAARRHGVDPGLVLAVVAVESAFRPEAVSPKGAQGLMQLMPGTAAALGVTDAFDPAANLDGGARHLAELIARYRGELRLALAAYNAGAGAVARHAGVPPYRETRDYLERVLSRYRASTP